VSTASAQAVDARDEARLVQAAITALSGDASRAIANLRGEMASAKSEWVALESPVLTLSSAVTALMDHAGLGPAGGITETSLEQGSSSTTRRSMESRSEESGSLDERRPWIGQGSTYPRTPTSASGE
jgi:hypothetical protein